ncbi:MAG: hypothetical protein M5U01_26745 [Ardenticatenaceae bacterium]|nr:hypothetical protein [Ardenticatenaceae bacterium]
MTAHNVTRRLPGADLSSDFAVVEAILRDRRSFFDGIRDGQALGIKIRAMLISSIAFLMVYGGVMGSTHSLAQTISSALKLPALFLVTLLICLPTLYFFNVLFGSSQSLAQNFALILTAVTVTSVLLLSFAPITLFFMLTSSNYQFFKLLNVAIFAITGVIGVTFLYQGMTYISTNDELAALAALPTESLDEQARANELRRQAETGRQARKRILQLWVLVYAFVGTQMAWTLRPFFGAPGLPFEPFRQLGGNFYTNILASLAEVFGFGIVH